MLVVILLMLFERRFPLEAQQPWRPWLFNIVWHMLFPAVSVVLAWTAWGQFVTWLWASGRLSLIRMAPAQGLAGAVARQGMVMGRLGSTTQRRRIRIDGSSCSRLSTGGEWRGACLSGSEPRAPASVVCVT